MATKERRRVSKEDVVQNARDSASGSRMPQLKLPKGVRLWAPDKKGEFELNFLPYVITIDDHPDKIDKDMIWYKYPFNVHRNVGVNQDSEICPGSVGKPCPICKHRAKLAKDYEDNEDAIKACNSQKWVAYVIVDPDDEDKVAVFAMSRSKFAEPLEKELQEGSDKNINFYDVNKDGRTLTVRFSEEKYEGRKFLQASRFDFEPRKEMDEDDIFEKTVCLDELFEGVMDEEKLAAKFFQTASAGKKGKKEDEPEEKDKDDDDEKPAKKSKKEESEEKEDSVDFEEGDMVSFKNKKGEKIKGKIVDIDKEDVRIEDKDGDDHDAELGDLTLISKAEPDEPDEKEDEPEEKEKEKDEDDGPTFEAGDKVIYNDDDDEGEFIKLHSSGEKAKVKDKDDEEVWVPIEDVKAIKKPKKEDKAAKKDEGSKKGDKSLPQCPVEGGKFGKDCDKYNQCDDCPHWKACEALSTKR